MILISKISSAAYNVPKKINFYVKVFDKSDPETIFLDEAGNFSHKDFVKCYTSFLNSFKKKSQRIFKIDWVGIIPLVRAVVAHSRYNDRVSELFIRLPRDNFFRALIKNYFERYIETKIVFEKNIASPFDHSLDVILAYMKLENDSIMAGSIILFICSLHRQPDSDNREVEHLEHVIQYHLEESKLRLKITLNKQSKLSHNIFAALVKLANDTDGLFYHTGARFNIAGQLIMETKLEHDEFVQEVQELLDPVASETLIVFDE